MYSDTTGTDKNHPRQNLPGKRSLTKPPGQKPREQLIQNLYKGAFVRVFCTMPSKNGEGVPGCVTECDKGEGVVKIGQK